MGTVILVTPANRLASSHTVPQPACELTSYCSPAQYLPLYGPDRPSLTQCVSVARWMCACKVKLFQNTCMRLGTASFSTRPPSVLKASEIYWNLFIFALVLLILILIVVSYCSPHFSLFCLEREILFLF